MNIKFHGASLDDPGMSEIADIVKAVVIDGRYIHEFHADPIAVAHRIKAEISPEALRVLPNIKLTELLPEEEGRPVAAGVAAVAVAVVIVVTREAYEDVIKDTSGAGKL